MSDFTVQIEDPSLITVDLTTTAAIVVESGIPGPAGPPGGGSARYERTFMETDLSGAGLLIVTHSLGVIPDSTRVLNPAGEEVYPDNITDLSTAMLSVEMQSFRPLAGVYRLIIGG